MFVPSIPIQFTCLQQQNKKPDPRKFQINRCNILLQVIDLFPRDIRFFLYFLLSFIHIHSITDGDCQVASIGLQRLWRFGSE